MHLGLAFKHIESSGGDALVAQSCGQRNVIHNPAARDVHQRCGGLHHRQFGSANRVMRLGRIWQHQHEVIGGAQQFLLGHVTGFTFCFHRSVKARAVVINHLHAKTMRAAFGNALADAPHAQHTQRRAVNVRACKHVVAPLRPISGAQVMLAFGHAPRGSHHQRETEVSGGLSQHIGGVGCQYTGSRHRFDIKIVVAHRHVGAYFQLGACSQHFGVDAVASGSESAVLVTQSLSKLRL